MLLKSGDYKIWKPNLSVLLPVILLKVPLAHILILFSIIILFLINLLIL